MYEIKYRKPEEMKDSGVEWLGEIPREWEKKQLKYLITRNDGGIWGEEPTNENNTAVFRSTEITVDGKWDFSELAYRKIKRTDVKRYKLKKGDLLITKSSGSPQHIGKTGLVDSEIEKSNAVYSNFMQRIRLKEGINPKLIYYVLNNNLIRKQVEFLGTTTTGLMNLNASLINKLLIVICTTLEQQKIANFLDIKTSQLDCLISKKEKLIEKLEEAKKSLISEVVTGKVKIVDGELVKREPREMKDVINSFFNQVPKDWKISKLKHITNQIIDGTHFTPTYVDDGVPFLRVTDITQSQNNQIDLNNVMYISFKEHKELTKRCKPRRGDLLVSKNGTIGIPKVVDWDWEFSIFVSLCLIKLRNSLNANLLAYFFKSGLLDKQIAYGGKTTSITNLHLDRIREFFVVIPSDNEQQNIVDYLDKRILKLDKVINKNKFQIQKLTQAKESLIFEAVTGKIDLRDWEIIEEGEVQ